MEKYVLKFSEQLNFQPKIENADNFKPSDKFIVCGMGGSHLSAGLIKVANPYLDLLIHRDYGLPRVPDYFLNQSLIILSSYSGNTEEVLDSFNQSLKQNLNIAVITSGGELLKLAEENKIPFIKIPDTGIPPRLAIGFSTIALLKITRQEDEIKKLSVLADNISPEKFQERGEEIAEKIKGKIPLIYSSTINLPIAYNWKIKFNETGKISAFYNVFPELNHNEINGFDSADNSNFSFIFLKSDRDSKQIKKRMDLTSEILKEKGFSVLTEDFSSENIWEEIFSSLITADWASLKIAKDRGVDPLLTPTIEDFKKRMKS